jgi:lipoprotein-anchoring transpeptidase ErfK/SrfK
MRRILASAPAVLSIAAGTIPLLIATMTPAASQLLDPGWQIGVAAPPRYSPGGGLIEYMFGDGPGLPVVAYPPAPNYYQPMPMPRRQTYMPAPAYYYQQVPAPQARVYQPAPVYYQQVPAPQARTYSPAPAYYQATAPQPRAYQGPRVSYQQVPVPQLSANLTLPTNYQQPPGPQQGAAQTTPQYTGSVQPPPQPAAAPAPHRSFFQLTSPQEQATGAPMPQAAPPVPQPAAQQAPAPEPQRSFFQLTPPLQRPAAYSAPPDYAPSEYGDMAHPIVDPKYDRQLVDYKTDEPPGTIVVDTPHYFLYLVMEGGKAVRYGIGVGRQGYTWSGVNEISAMREWPDWRPPTEMLERRPDLPRYVAGGEDNPLGARALYIGATLYRIHGSNEPWTIGTQVSSGCIRLRNPDVVDLYGRVKVGAKVVVL